MWWNLESKTHMLEDVVINATYHRNHMRELRRDEHTMFPQLVQNAIRLYANCATTVYRLKKGATSMAVPIVNTAKKHISITVVKKTEISYNAIRIKSVATWLLSSIMNTWKTVSIAWSSMLYDWKYGCLRFIYHF